MDKPNDSNENNRTVFTFGQDVIVNGKKGKIVHGLLGFWTIDIDGRWKEYPESEISIPKSASAPTDKKTTAEEMLRKFAKIKDDVGRFNFLNHTLITTKQALKAMEEYATTLLLAKEQEIQEKEREIERLKEELDIRRLRNRH